MKMVGHRQYKGPKTPGRRVNDASSNFMKKREILFTAVVVTLLWSLISLLTMPQITKTLRNCEGSGDLRKDHSFQLLYWHWRQVC